MNSIANNSEQWMETDNEIPYYSDDTYPMSRIIAPVSSGNLNQHINTYKLTSYPYVTLMLFLPIFVPNMVAPWFVSEIADIHCTFTYTLLLGVMPGGGHVFWGSCHVLTSNAVIVILIMFFCIQQSHMSSNLSTPTTTHHGTVSLISTIHVFRSNQT